MTSIKQQIPPQRIIAEARKWINTPYQHQASCIGSGTDCLGLIRGIYRTLYGKEPQKPPPYNPYASHQEPENLKKAAQRYLIQIKTKPKPGHVLLFRMHRGLPARHLAILSDNHHMIHAMAGIHVCEVQFNQWWKRHCIAAFAFPLTTYKS